MPPSRLPMESKAISPPQYATSTPTARSPTDAATETIPADIPPKIVVAGPVLV